MRIDGRDQQGREKLAQYILRAPVSQEKMRDHATRRTVIYRSKMHRVLTRNFEIFPVLDWIAAVPAHIPNKGEHVLRYYGWVSNVKNSPTAGLIDLQAALGGVHQEGLCGRSAVVCPVWGRDAHHCVY